MYMHAKKCKWVSLSRFNTVLTFLNVLQNVSFTVDCSFCSVQFINDMTLVYHFCREAEQSKMNQQRQNKLLGWLNQEQLISEQFSEETLKRLQREKVQKSLAKELAAKLAYYVINDGRIGELILIEFFLI